MDELKEERIKLFFESSGLNQVLMTHAQREAYWNIFSKEYDENPPKFIPYVNPEKQSGG